MKSTKKRGRPVEKMKRTMILLQMIGGDMPGKIVDQNTVEVVEMTETGEITDVMINTINMIGETTGEMIEGIETDIATKATETITGIGIGEGEVEVVRETRIMTDTEIKIGIEDHQGTEEMDQGTEGIETETGTSIEPESTTDKINTVMIGTTATQEIDRGHKNNAQNQAQDLDFRKIALLRILA
jgi:hypothetical protein